MKVILLLLIGCFELLAAHAQKIRFTDSANVWRYEDGCSCYDDPSRGRYPVFKFYTDTTAYNHRYKRIKMTPLPSGEGPLIQDYLVREDTAVGIVYFRNYQPANGAQNLDTLEHVLYNYNWIAGDSIIPRAATSPYAIHPRYTITTVTATNINGVPHRMWTAKNVVDTNTPFGEARAFTIIEDIGCTEYAAYPIYPYFFEESTRLICFQNHGGRPSVNPAVQGFDNAASCSLDASGIQSRQARIIIAPNPGDRNAVLILSDHFTGSTGVITNAFGMVVSTFSIEGRKSISIARYLPLSGVYYYTLQDAVTGERFTGCFLFAP